MNRQSLSRFPSLDVSTVLWAGYISVVYFDSYVIPKVEYGHQNAVMWKCVFVCEFTGVIDLCLHTHFIETARIA